MEYEGTIIRPPSEAASLILQVTVGCSHNKCTFCPAYKRKRFRLKSLEEIGACIRQAAQSRPDDVRRIFLCDGDPLCMPQDRITTILVWLNEAFPRLQRVGIYANAQSILRKTEAELKALRARKLGIVYMGLESGDPVTLERVCKGAGPEEMIAAARLLRQAGMKLNVTVLLGVGGRERSIIHARSTMQVLNRMAPNHVGALTLMVVKGTPLYDASRRGDFALPEKFELIEELRTMIRESELENCLFFSNHASNYVPLTVRLPRDKDAALRLLDQLIASKDAGCLRDERMRGL